MTDYSEGFSPAEMLVMTNTAAAEVISSDQSGIDATGADLIMSNLAVATDRLEADDFAALPIEVQDQVFALAFMADDIAPMDEGDLIRHPHEDDKAYAYRVGVSQRIHNLQAYVHKKSHDPQNELELSKIRFAVQGAGRAFAAVIEETQHLPAVAETIRYFTGNAQGAAKRALQVGRLATLQSREPEQDL